MVDGGPAPEVGIEVEPGVPAATVAHLEGLGLVAHGRLTPAGLEASLAFLTQWGSRVEPLLEPEPDGRGGRI
jgi:hypothetical protein